MLVFATFLSFATTVVALRVYAPSALAGVGVLGFCPAFFALMLQGMLWCAVSVAMSSVFRHAAAAAFASLILLVGIPRGGWAALLAWAPLGRPAFGEMILDAAAHGATRIVMGIGGSATNDGGAGMLQALGFRLLDAEGKDLPRGGAALARLARIEPSVSQLSFRIACDVTNPLCGARGASAVFGPQKGATPEMVRELDAGLAQLG